MPELTKMTTKGQVVIPSEIRKELGLGEGSQMVVSNLGELILLRKLAIPDLKKELDELTKWGSKIARKKGIRTEADVVRIIHKGRGLNVD